MLVGGCDGTVSVLHAVPDEWSNGEFSGIVSRGGVELDCKWIDGKVVYLAATARSDISIEFLLPGSEKGKRESMRIDFTKGLRKIIID